MRKIENYLLAINTLITNIFCLTAVKTLLPRDLKNVTRISSSGGLHSAAAEASHLTCGPLGQNIWPGRNKSLIYSKQQTGFWVKVIGIISNQNPSVMFLQCSLNAKICTGSITSALPLAETQLAIMCSDAGSEHCSESRFLAKNHQREESKF